MMISPHLLLSLPKPYLAAEGTASRPLTQQTAPVLSRAGYGQTPGRGGCPSLHRDAAETAELCEPAVFGKHGCLPEDHHQGSGNLAIMGRQKYPKRPFEKGGGEQETSVSEHLCNPGSVYWISLEWVDSPTHQPIRYCSSWVMGFGLLDQERSLS